MRKLPHCTVFYLIIWVFLIILPGFRTVPLYAGSTDLRCITVLATGDLQGLMDPTDTSFNSSEGGIARIATIIKKIRAQSENPVLVVSTGDDLMNRYFHAFQGKAIFRLMTFSGYDLYSLGNHEFDKGPQVLADALKISGFETLCTDLNISRTPMEGLCRPWIIRHFSGIGIGFFSLMTEDFSLVTSGQPVQLIANNVAMAQKAIEDLRQAGAQLIIAITHIGLSEDQALAASVSGIDLIIGGHSHDFFSAPVRVGNTLIVPTGEKGAKMVRLDLVVDGQGNIELGQSRYTLIPVDVSVAEDSEIRVLLDQYLETFPPAVILGHTIREWNLASHVLRRGEAPVANMINDLLRKKFQVDIVFNNAGAFRGKRIYSPGPVTDQMLKEIDEFSNLAYRLSIEGRYIKQILERSAANFGEGGLMHASGLRYRIDLKQNDQHIAKDDQGRWRVIREGNRVSGIEVQDAQGGWHALNPNQNYTVLSNDFLINKEGDGYFWFKQFGKKFRNTYSTFYSILAETIGQAGALNPEKPDGRLMISP